MFDLCLEINKRSELNCALCKLEIVGFCMSNEVKHNIVDKIANFNLANLCLKDGNIPME